MKIYALPGFMGEQQDWEGFHPDIISCSLRARHLPLPDEGFTAWSRAFNLASSQDSSKKILMGYSLGGRLALHCLQEDLCQWDAVILISTNLGMDCPKARLKRLKHDEEWAKRFEKDAWESLMRDWESQGVFAGVPSPFKRTESDRDFYASVLRHWSLGRQAYFARFVETLPLPILWIAGENDLSGQLQAKRLQFRHPKSQVWIAPNAGHRVPWERKKCFTHKLERTIYEWNISA